MLNIWRLGWRVVLLALLLSVFGFAACSAEKAPSQDAGVTTTTSGAGGSENGCSEACSGDAPVCDPATGQCVGCLQGTCADGEYCDLTNNTCQPGCDDDSDCTSPETCDTATHACVRCKVDGDCPAGEICSGGTCATGCNNSSQCGTDEACCNGACMNLSNDVANCGSCGNICPSLDQAEVVCNAGQCEFDKCKEGFADCNNNTNDGCEWDLAQGPCSCKPGESIACYTGPPGTQGKGVCADGVSACLPDGGGYGPCGGQVLPGFDWCGDQLDNDCDGTKDNPPDIDNDGWNICEGDCCDSTVECGSPELVNPGAFEVAGNMLDDDCDGIQDNALGSCDAGIVSNETDPMKFAKAIDLCATTTANPSDPKLRNWGVISAGFKLAQGGGKYNKDSHAVRAGFGNNITALGGSNLAILSTGVAAAQQAPHNQSPAWQAFQLGADMGTNSKMPTDWLNANNMVPPNAPGCPQPDTKANDSIMLELSVRVPTNAKSFSFNTFFFSSEYPEWVCSPFNDFFLALLDSKFVPGPGQDPNPKDKNIAVYNAGGGKVYPLGVNLAHGNTGLFKQCENGLTGCNTLAIQGNVTSCQGVQLLAGTGFDIPKAPSFTGSKCCCGSNDLSGGGTGWLKASGNVVPGEVIKLRFVIWDTGDQYLDSLVLLDNFQWSLDASTPGVSE